MRRIYIQKIETKKWKKIIVHFLIFLIQKMMFVPNQYCFSYNTTNTLASIPAANIELQQRSRFTKTEDQLLKQLAESQQKPNWSEISRQLRGRTARQCRERYNNYLRPNLINGPWTPEEDKLLLELFEQQGPKWALIAHSFNSRSAVNVKNRYSTLMGHAASKNRQFEYEEIQENKIEEEKIVENNNVNGVIVTDESKNENEPDFNTNDDFENMFSNYEFCDNLWPSPMVSIGDDDLLAF